MSSFVDWLAAFFPDARPTWVPFAALAMCAMVGLIILAGLFPSIPERLAHIEFKESWHGLRGAVVRGRRAPRGGHHESPTPALAEDPEASGDGDATSPAGLGA